MQRNVDSIILFDQVNTIPGRADGPCLTLVGFSSALSSISCLAGAHEQYAHKNVPFSERNWSQLSQLLQRPLATPRKSLFDILGNSTGKKSTYPHFKFMHSVYSQNSLVICVLYISNASMRSALCMYNRTAEVVVASRFFELMVG